MMSWIADMSCGLTNWDNNVALVYVRKQQIICQEDINPKTPIVPSRKINISVSKINFGESLQLSYTLDKVNIPGIPTLNISQESNASSQCITDPALLQQIKQIAYHTSSGVSQFVYSPRLHRRVICLLSAYSSYDDHNLHVNPSYG